ncbi:MAG: deoxyribodipyrimidine photo-lyase [Chloroflexota bacterium]
MAQETIAIWWIRRDLRLRDNPALMAALEQATAVLPLFILDPTLQQSDYVGSKRLAFLLEGLRVLDTDLRRRGSRLIVREGRPEKVLPALATEVGATAVFAEPDYSVYAKRRDGRLAELVTFIGNPAIRPPGDVLKKDGLPYTVFTPFSKVWKALPLPHRRDLRPAPAAINTPSSVESLPLPREPRLPVSVPFRAGEAAGRERLRNFVADLQAIGRYAARRDLMGEAGTSLLSPYLRFGMVSARETAVCTLETLAQNSDPDIRKGAETWLNELIWRDFYIHILHHFPHVSQGNFRPQWDGIVWRNDETEFAAWCAGKTGYPVVDAAMRQLNETGWMHNRARMIVASFLVKDLLIDWRWGERYFMQQLVDGDPAANNGGWQWAAGTGTDAAPYFRIFNPVSQSKKFDGNGRYLRRWLPELANVPDKQIHEPWTMPPLLQMTTHCRLGVDYPHPIVNHKEARLRTLEAYKLAKELHAATG